MADKKHSWGTDKEFPDSWEVCKNCGCIKYRITFYGGANSFTRTKYFALGTVYDKVPACDIPTLVNNATDYMMRIFPEK